MLRTKQPDSGTVSFDAVTRSPEETPTVLIDARVSVLLNLLEEAVSISKRPMTMGNYSLLGHKVRVSQELAQDMGFDK